MRKTLSRITIMFLVAIFSLTGIISMTAFASESVGNAMVLENETADNESTLITCEEIDPNIVVVVTEITENSDIPSPYGLDRVDTPFNYSGHWDGPVRYYSGNHFSVDLTTSSNGSGNFTLKLVRVNGIFAITVGKVELPQNGTFHVEFLNVNNPNNYRFDFHQGAFNTYDQKGTMTIWNWD